MPIGSFESAWENYDHSDGPALIAQAKEHEKVGSKAPNWRLKIGGENWSRRLISCEVTYSEDGAASMRFSVVGKLGFPGKERAQVHFWMGYGTRLVPYFFGYLTNPVDDPSGIYSEAEAYSGATQRGENYFQDRADYVGEDALETVETIWTRSGADADRLAIATSDSTTIARKIGAFGYEVSFLEAIQTIVEPMQLIAYDNLGGIFTVKRNHLAALGADEIFTGAGSYSPEDYPLEGFQMGQSYSNFYDDVTIFRRTDDYAGGGGGPGEWAPGGPYSGDGPNEYAVFVNKDVTGDGGVASAGPYVVNPRRDYVVADYPGTQADAERDRAFLVNSFSRGVGEATWTPFPCDYDLGDHVLVHVDEQIHDPDYLFSRTHYRQARIDRVGFAYCIAETTFRMSAATEGTGSDTRAVGAEAWGMDTSGYAFEMSRETIRPMGSVVEIDLGVAPDAAPEEDPGAVDFRFVAAEDGRRIRTEDGHFVTLDP